MGGRRPKPNAIKELTGNPGKRPLNHDEPQTAHREPEIPRGLDAAARREWRRIVPELLDLGVLSTVDGAALGAYCSAYSLWIKAEKAIQRKGLLLEEPIFDKRGEVVGTKTRRNPAVGISTEAMKVMKSFLIEFGLTPAARTKVKVEPQTEEDPLEALLRAKPPERKVLICSRDWLGRVPRF